MINYKKRLGGTGGKGKYEERNLTWCFPAGQILSLAADIDSWRQTKRNIFPTVERALVGWENKDEFGIKKASKKSRLRQGQLHSTPL